MYCALGSAAMAASTVNCKAHASMKAPMMQTMTSLSCLLTSSAVERCIGEVVANAPRFCVRSSFELCVSLCDTLDLISLTMFGRASSPGSPLLRIAGLSLPRALLVAVSDDTGVVVLLHANTTPRRVSAI